MVKYLRDVRQESALPSSCHGWAPPRVVTSSGHRAPGLISFAEIWVVHYNHWGDSAVLSVHHCHQLIFEVDFILITLVSMACDIYESCWEDTKRSSCDATQFSSITFCDSSPKVCIISDYREMSQFICFSSFFNEQWLWYVCFFHNRN